MTEAPFARRVDEHIAKLEALTGHYLVPLNSAYRAAHEDFLKFHAPMMRLYNAREYANAMHVHLRDQIKKHFANVPEACFDEKPGRAFKLLIDGRGKGIDVFAAFILKKLRPGYRTANIPTKTATDYSRQIIDYLVFEPIFQPSLIDIKGDGKTETIVNLPKCANLVAGYQIDATWGAFEQLAITMPFSLRKIILIKDFTTVTAAAVADIVEMPQPQVEKPSRIRRRTTAAAKRDNITRFTQLSTSDISEDADIRKFNERNG